MKGRARGFTLLELLVSMGLLTALGVLVLRLLTGGIDLWSRGEEVRDLLVRATSVADLVCQDLEQLSGTGEGPVAAGRLVHAPMVVPGLDGAPVPVVRFLRQLRPWEEARRALRDEGSAGAALGEAPSGLAGRLEGLGRRDGPEDPGGPGEGGAEPELPLQPPRRAERALVLLFPMVSRHEAEAPGAYLSLRRGEVRGSGVGHRHAWFGREPFAGVEEMLRQTEEVYDGLLHFELRYWSQTTRSWEGLPGEGGPEQAWDSTRGGATLQGDGPRFSFDLGPWSLDAPWDDLVPRAILLELVVDGPPGEVRSALLRQGIDDKETGPVWIGYPERLGSEDGPGHCKIGGEWIRYRERKGDFLHGLERGARGTRPAAHPSGAPLRVGWTVRRMIRPEQPREWWGPAAPERGDR